MRQRKKREASAEKSFVAGIKKRGAKSRKLNGLGFRAWPDRLVFGHNGVIMLVEFKRVGEDLTPLQASLHRDFARMGIRVYVFTSATDALAEYDKLVAMRGEIMQTLGRVTTKLNRASKNAAKLAGIHHDKPFGSINKPFPDKHPRRARAHKKGILCTRPAGHAGKCNGMERVRCHKGAI